jgi:hypothetical protein
MTLILETWDLASSFCQIQNFREYLQADLNDEGFYNDAIITFSLKVSGMTELKRKEEDFPSATHMKQLKVLEKNN